MKTSTFLAELSEATGLRRFRARTYTIELIKDGVVGLCGGYIVAIGPSRESRVRLFIRFAPVESGEWFADVMQVVGAEFPGVKFPAEDEYADIDEVDSLVIDWNPSSTDRVRALLDACLRAVKGITKPLPPECEICSEAHVSELTLRDGIPGYYCRACQDKEIKKTPDAEAQERGTAGRDYARCTSYALGAAVCWGLTAAYIATFMLPGAQLSDAGGLLFFGTMLGEAAIGFAAFRGAGSTDETVMHIVLASSLIGIFVANFEYYCFLAARNTNELRFGFELPRAALALFIQAPLRHVAALLFSVLTAFVGWGLMVSAGERHGKVTFEPLDLPDKD